MGFENIDFALYFNIAFFSVLAFGLLFGILKGYRRSLYTFIITIIFIAIFFLTITPIVRYIYTLEMNFIGGLLGNVSSGLSQTTSVQEAARLFLFNKIGDNLSTSQTNPEFLAFVDAMGMFVLKIVYTILYFTLIQFLYRFILFIASLFIFRKGRSKSKNGKRGRALGGVFGTLTATVNVFVMIIVLSGVISISESLVSLQGEQLSYTVNLENNVKPNITSIDQSLTKIGNLNPQQMAETNSELDDAMASLETMITEYNNNIIIQAINAYQVEDEVTGENKNAAIILFDEVLSINYDNQNIALRQDLRTFTEIAGIFLNSDFYDTNDLADLNSQEVNDMFSTLSESKLITTIIPIGIEVGMDYMDIDLELSKEMLYEDIDWRDELEQLGVVASTGFMILENANAFDQDVDYKTISLDGQEVEGLFTELSNSKLAEYGAYIAIEPLLEGASATLKSVITVPDNINWQEEFHAFGAIANEILSTGITIADLEGENQQDLLMLFTNVDLTVMLDSQLTSNALINIFSGQAEIDFNIDFLVIPNIDNIQWKDTVDELTGEVTQAGELRNILTSLNILVQQLDNIDMNNLQIQDLSALTDGEIDEMFESVILVASISELITNLDTGDFNLIIPDRVLDDNQYIVKEEVTNIFKALTMAAREIPCDKDNISCADIGFDMDKVTQLSSDNVDTLFESDILYATTASMLNDFEELIVPEDIKEDVLVDGLILSIPNKQEIKNTFSAITALGITDFGGISISGDLLLNLAVDPVTDPTTLDTTKTDKLFASKILHATISYFILQETNVTPPETSPLIIPYYAAEDYGDTTTDIVRYYDTAGEVDYISDNELTNLLQAILVLNISDFSTFDTIDISTIISNSEIILGSAIFHATISDQIRTLDGSGLVIPNKDELNNDLMITTGDILEEQTTYIIKSELIATLDSLEVLEITDFNNVNIDTTIIKKLSIDEVTNPTELSSDKMTTLLASKIVHATISKVILDAAEPDELTLESDIIIPTYAADNYDYGSNEVTVTTSDLDKYIVEDELNNLLQAYLLLEINDFNEVNNLDLTLIAGNIEEILASAILHATITKTILDAAEVDPITNESDLLVPYFAADPYGTTSSNVVRETINGTDTYITKLELRELFQVLDVLGITGFSDVESALTLSNMIANKTELMDSAILHATMSDSIIKENTAGTIIVPYEATENYEGSTSNFVRISIDTTLDDSSVHTDTYITKNEFNKLFDALEALGITDFNNVGTALTLSNMITNKTALLESAILHATMSDSIIEENTAGTIIVPYEASVDYTGTTSNLVRVSIDTTLDDSSVHTDTYISKNELNKLFDALTALGITDFTDVLTALTLPNMIANKTPLLESAILHATMSDIIIEESTPDVITNESNLILPKEAIDNYVGTSSKLVKVDIVTTFDDLSTHTDKYVSINELNELFEALDVLGVQDFNTISTALSISNMLLNINDLLESAIIHATISEQILDLDSDSKINVPNKDINENVIIYSQLDSTSYDAYIIKNEIINLIEGLDLLGATDISGFDGDLDISGLSLGTDQDEVLESAILHSTFSNKLITLDNAILIVPEYSQEGETQDYLIKKTIDLTEYIVKDELKAIISAFIIMNVGSINNITNFELSKFFDNPDTLLLSSSIQATVSNKLLNDTAGALIIPDNDINDDPEKVIRIIQTDVTYIDLVELEALLAGLESLGLTNFSGITFTTTNIFAADYTVVLNSASLQATISDTILAGAVDENNITSTSDLIVPTFFRETITVNSVNATHIEKAELHNLLTGLKELGVTSFTGGVDPAIVTSLTSTQLTTILNSGSLHVTIDNMLQANASLTIPTFVLVDLYNIVGLIEKTEIVNFVAAVNTLGETDITNATINFSTITSLTPTEQSTVLDSAIIRATITPDVETAKSTAEVFDPYTGTWEYESDGTTLTKASIQGVINQYY